MELKNFFALDDQGNTLPGATCYLYERGNETLVNGLQGANGLPLNNPFAADHQGLVQFAAPNGLYDLRVVKGNRDNRIRLQFNDVVETSEAAEGAARALQQKLADPVQGTEMIGWTDPFAPKFLKTISDMKAGEPVSLFRIVPKEEREGIESGTSTYDCAPNINAAEDLFQTKTLKGGVLEVPRGRIMASDLSFRGGFTLQGAGHSATELILGDSATIKLTGTHNRIQDVRIHKNTPKENYITAGDRVVPAAIASLTSIQRCQFTATKLEEFVNYALVGNYRSYGIELVGNIMYTYHLAFITKYLTSDWVRLVGNQVFALNSTNVFNSELFKIEAVTKGFISQNLLRSIGVPGGLSCLTLESGASNVLVHHNVIEVDHGYGVRIENTDKTISPPTDCALDKNTIIATGSALAIYSGNVACKNLSVSGGHVTGPITLYGTNTSLTGVKVSSVPGDPRTGVTLRGDYVKAHDNEINGFGVGLANAAVSVAPDRDLSVKRNVFKGQAHESINLRYLTGKCFLEHNPINNQSLAKGAILLTGGGEPSEDSTLSVKAGSIVSPNMPGVMVDFMNGVTLSECDEIKSSVRVAFDTSDGYIKEEQTFIAANFTNKSHRVNTKAKYAGRIAFNKDPRKPYFATGPLPTDIWVDAAGAVVYTPV